MDIDDSVPTSWVIRSLFGARSTSVPVSSSSPDTCLRNPQLWSGLSVAGPEQNQPTKE